MDEWIRKNKVVYVSTQWNVIQPLKEGNPAICDNMGGQREREREREELRKMEIGNRLVVARGWDLWGVSGEMGKGGLKVQISTY